MGFVPYVLEDLDFADQVRLFAQAEFIIAPHGGGVTNIIFSKNLSLIELFGQKISHFYYTVAQGLGFDYTCMLCESKKKPITLASLRVTNYRSYEELKEAGLTRVIELSSPPELSVNNIPIVVIPQGVFHSAITSNRCLMLNLGKKFGISSNYREYSKLEYQTYAR